MLIIKQERIAVDFNCKINAILAFLGTLLVGDHNEKWKPR